MTPQCDTSDDLEQVGWRQCSVFEGRDIPGLKAAVDEYQDDDIFIVLPYSCAVVSMDFAKEPYVELFRLRRSDVKKRANHHGRNPRNIQIEIVDNGKKVFLDGSIHDRFFVKHSLFLGGRPNKSLELAENQCVVVKNWFAKRYLRNAFPAAFNERARHALGKLKGILKKSSDIDNLLAVYLTLDPHDEELTDPDNPYDVEVVFLTTEAGRLDDDLIKLKGDFIYLIYEPQPIQSILESVGLTPFNFISIL